MDLYGNQREYVNLEVNSSVTDVIPENDLLCKDYCHNILSTICLARYKCKNKIKN